MIPLLQVLRMPFEKNISASVLMLIVLLVLLLILTAVLSLLLSALTVLAILLILIVLLVIPLIAAAVVLLVLIIAHFLSSFPYAPQMTAAQADEAATIAIMAAKQVFIPVTIIFIKFLAITEYKLYNSITE